MRPCSITAFVEIRPGHSNYVIFLIDRVEWLVIPSSDGAIKEKAGQPTLV